MSYGFDLGRIHSDSVGVSYIDEFTHTGETTTKLYSSPVFEFVTQVQTFIAPVEDINADFIVEFPAITTAFSNEAKSISVEVSGGNVAASILVFVR